MTSLTERLAAGIKQHSDASAFYRDQGEQIEQSRQEMLLSAANKESELEAQVSEFIATSDERLPLFNLYEDSGKLAPPGTGFYVGEDSPLYLPDQLVMYNGSTVEKVGRAKHTENSDGEHPLAVAIKAQSGAHSQYGMEFHVARITMGDGVVGRNGAMPAGIDHHLMIFDNHSRPLGVWKTHALWAQVVQGAVSTTNTNAYINGGPLVQDREVTPSDGAFHYLCNAAGAHLDYSIQHLLYAAPGTQLDIALPVALLGRITGLIHGSAIRHLGEL